MGAEREARLSYYGHMELLMPDSQQAQARRYDWQGCRGYGYPWIYPWIYPCVDIRLDHPVDLSMDIFIYFNSND